MDFNIDSNKDTRYKDINKLNNNMISLSNKRNKD